MHARFAAFAVLAACAHSPAPPPGPAAYVDEALGTDDAAHGHGPGAEAYASITYALAHASGLIHVAAGSYATRETFPLTMTGEQQLACDAGATILGAGDTTLDLAGSANQVTGCSLGASTNAGVSTCIALASDGAHLIASTSVTACSIVVDFAGHSGATLRNVGVANQTPVGANCLNQVGDDVRLESFACSAQNDWIFVWGTGLSGCNTVPSGRVAGGNTPLPALDGPC